MVHRSIHGGVVLGSLWLLVAMPLAAQQKPVLEPDDYGRFENIGAGQLSQNGQWLAVSISRVNEETELRIHQVATDSTIVVANGMSASFAPGGRWAGYLIGHSQKERDAAQKSSLTLHSRLALLNLQTGVVDTVSDIAQFAFSGDGRYVAMQGYAPKEQKTRGVDLIVRDLARGVQTALGDVADYGWQDEGSLLAFVVDAETKAANGVKLFDPATSVLRTLDTDTAGYRHLVWRRKSDDLAVMRAAGDTLHEGSNHLVLAWTGLSGRKPMTYTFDPVKAAGFPAEHRVVDFRPLNWTKDGRTLFFGIKEWELKSPKDSAAVADADKPGIEIWHAQDVDIMPEQKVRAQRDRERNFLAAWHPQAGTFVQIANELVENASPARLGPISVATDETPYEREAMFGPNYMDLYVVDTNTGERVRVKDRIQFNMGVSPTGRYVLYAMEGAYWLYDVQKKAHTNLTKGISTSFFNDEDDHTIDEKPPYGVAGWSPNDATVMLYDKFDVWEISPDASKATRLTDGAGESVRYRFVFLDLDQDFRDPSKPVYAALYGEKTKKFGYGTVQRGRKPDKRIWLDANVGRLAKAKDAEVYAWVSMDFNDSPDYFVGGPSLADGRQVTHTNVFQKDYAWGRAELIDFQNRAGRDLQAGLYYPANYDPSKKYPMIVYIYEIVSNQLHNYSVPSERNPYNPTVWTQDGYFVLMPDIVYRDRNPGLSAADAIVPAVEKVVSLGIVDKDRVGLVGHSWGGYQTAFVGTTTNTFAAAVAGAPLTELASMYLSVYWNTGGTDARIFEISQGRMEVPPWRDPESYMRNSAVWNIEKMTTPMLVTFGDKDGAVDWHQGIEMYNAARREDKDLVLLVYEGENHGLAKKPNQIDYHRRVMTWFNHYLKGDPAPDWMTKGIRFLDRDKEVKRVTTKPISNE